jgi:hypothetical protein
VVPFERYFRNAAIVDAKRTALRKGDALELRLHRGTLFGHLAITCCPNNINSWPIRIIQELAQILEWSTRLLRQESRKEGRRVARVFEADGVLLRAFHAS